MATNPCSAAILAGGQSSRMGGENKALLTLGSEQILAHLKRLMETCFQEVLLVVRDPIQYLDWDFTIVKDLSEKSSSLAGIQGALFHSTTEHTFITACDTPFIQHDVIKVLLENLSPKRDIVIPVTGNGFQPLCAIYSKRCLTFINEQIEAGDPKIIKFLKKVRVKEISEAQLRKVDPELISFFNVNTPDDYAQSQKILAAMDATKL